MLTVKELDQITKLLTRAHKNQLLTLVKHIESFPLKNKMSNEEYVQYLNEPRTSGITKYIISSKKRR